MKIVKKSNWTGRAIVCPRGAFEDHEHRPEFKKTGIYLPIGQASPDDLPTVYIGEGDQVGDRLTQHQKAAKDFWTTAVSFTSKDDNPNTAQVQYLEAQLVLRAGAAKRCNLDNGNALCFHRSPNQTKHQMEEFL